MGAMQSKSTGRSGQETSGVREWSRGRLITILIGAVVVALALLVGLGYAIYLAVSGLNGDNTATDDVATGETERSTVARGASHRDEIAAEPMLSVPRARRSPTTPATPTKAGKQSATRTASRSRPAPASTAPAWS